MKYNRDNCPKIVDVLSVCLCHIAQTPRKRRNTEEERSVPVIVVDLSAVSPLPLVVDKQNKGFLH